MKQSIRHYLETHQANGSAEGLTDDASLLEAGVLDSMMMVDLITFLETEYGISVTEDEMVPENFDSVDAIAAYVASKQITV